MRRFVSYVLLALLAGIGSAVAQETKTAAAPPWSMNATIIEACSCPMFCQCYFNSKPASAGGHAAHAAGATGESHEGHSTGGGEHYCRFNNAYQVNKGSYGKTKLDGAKFWVAGDLGDDFSDGEMNWAVLTFDPAVTKEQRDGIVAALTHLYPVKWKSFTVAPDAPIEWKNTKDRAEARLDGGKGAEVVLNRFAGMTGDRIVIHNLKYWGAPRNNGFELMPNEVEAWRGENAFQFNNTNGFMITFDINSKDVKS